MPLPGFWKEWKSGWGGGRLLGQALPPLLSSLFPLLRAGLLFRCVEAAATVGSWPPRASHRVSAAFTMAAAVPWAPAPTVSLMDGGRRIKKIAKSYCQVILSEGDVVWAFPWEHWAWSPAFPWEGEANQSKTAMLSPNCPSKVFFKKSNSSSESLQASRVSRMSQRTCLGRLARDWHI